MSTYNLYVDIFLHGEFLSPQQKKASEIKIHREGKCPLTNVCGNKNSPCRKMSTYNLYVDIFLHGEFLSPQKKKSSEIKIHRAGKCPHTFCMWK
jgi:hypothetical protein